MRGDPIMATRRKKRARRKRSSKLPNAPLAEVVFEFRWQLQAGAFVPFDPMLFPLLYNFTSAMEREGFSHIEEMAHPQQTGPFGVVRRFRRAAEKLFPIMQVGVGIFATNESSEYEWNTFKAQVLNGLKLLLSSYPTQFGTKIAPAYLELRYVDAFDKATLGSNSFFSFTETGTSLNLPMPALLEKPELFWGDATGRFLISRNLRGNKKSQFLMELGSGQNATTKEDLVQVVSKVVSM